MGMFSGLRTINMWYFKRQWEKLLYFLYRNIKFFRENIKLQQKFSWNDFWKDFKSSLRNPEPPPEKDYYCVIVKKGSNLTHVSRLCTTLKEANEVANGWALLKNGEDSGIDGAVVIVPESEAPKFVKARDALKHFNVIHLQEELKKRGTKKRDRTKRNSKRTKQKIR